MLPEQLLVIKMIMIIGELLLLQSDDLSGKPKRLCLMWDKGDFLI